MELRKKIYSEERAKGKIDDYEREQLREMTGWTEPEKGKWEVSLMWEDCFFTCENQAQAEILAALHEIKHKMFRKFEQV